MRFAAGRRAGSARPAASGLLMAAACLLAGASAARADFTAQMCNGRTAAPWVNGPNDNPFVGVQDECSTATGQEIFFISGTNSMPPGDSNDQAGVDAPAGEVFTHVAVQFHSDPDTNSQSFTELTWGYDKTLLSQAHSGDSSAGTSLDASLPNASSVSVALYCFNAGQGCTFADNDVVRVGELDLTVHDTGVPSVHPLGGSLATAGTYAGIQTLGFAATDVGSGVSRVTVSLGPTVVGTDSPACQSASLTPCPGNASGVIDVNTAAVPDGSYPVILTAYDASGDPAPVQVATVRTRNFSATQRLPRPRRGVRARVAISWRWSSTRTVLTRIALADVPRAGTVTVTCHGRGCPIRTVRSDRRHLAVLARHLRGRSFRPGDRLALTITAAGRRAQRAEIVIRPDAIPRVTAG